MAIDWLTFLYFASAGGGIGTGSVLAAKLIKEIRATNNPVGQAGGGAPENGSVLKGRSEERATQVLSLLDTGAVRLRGGGYLRGYWLDPAATLYADENSVDHLFDEIAAMMSSPGIPAGTGFQFRMAIHSDEQEKILNARLDLASKENVHFAAQQVKDDQLQYLEWLSSQGHVRRNLLTLWIYVPVKHTNDQNHNFILNAAAELRKGDLKAAFVGRHADVMQRTIDDEREALDRAEHVFGEIERMSPFGIRRMKREETWTALYYGYNENAASVPAAPESPFVDLRTILCATENIRANDNWFLLHGNTPVTILTLFLPPESNLKKRTCRAGMMRMISHNLGLRGRYTILTEFLTLDKEKVQKSFNRQKWTLDRVSRNSKQQKRNDKKSERAAAEIDSLEDELLSHGTNMTQMRLRIVLYGNPAFTQEDLRTSIAQLDSLSQNMLSEIRKKWKGADAALESPEALRSTYQNTLLGNMELKGKTEREHEEDISNFVAFVPAEDSWAGMPQPHTLKRTISGKTFGINFKNNPLAQSPLIVFLGTAGTGKSVEVATYVVDWLAEIPNARATLVDNGLTYEWLCRILKGKHYVFDPNVQTPINVWDYQGLGDGLPPEEAQVNMVVEDTAIIAGYDPTTEAGDFRNSLIFKCVVEVYRDFVPRNTYSVKQRHEPTLTNLIEKLRYFPFQRREEIDEAGRIASILETYQNHPWLDQPTHEMFRADSHLEVYEIGSLSLFDAKVGTCLAHRVTGRLNRSLGKKIDGEYQPELVIFEEMHEYRRENAEKEKVDLSVINRSLEKYTRKGRKTNKFTMLVTHGYEDLQDLHGLTKNAGVFIVGKQDDVSLLKEVRKWNDETERAVMNVESRPGEFSQFVINVGMAENQKTEVIQSDLSSQMYWITTSNPDERNAREKVLRHFPHFNDYQVIEWLSHYYGRGLKQQGKTEIDPHLLPSLLPETGEDFDQSRLPQPLAPKHTSPAAKMPQPAASAVASSNHRTPLPALAAAAAGAAPKTDDLDFSLDELDAMLEESNLFN